MGARVPLEDVMLHPSTRSAVSCLEIPYLPFESAPVAPHILRV